MTDAQASVLFRKGFAFHQQGELDTAQTYYEHVLTLNPRHGDALHLLGVVAQQTQDYPRAIALIGQALALAPDQALLHYNLGVALRGNAQTHDALLAMDKAIALKPAYADAHYSRANALKDLLRLDEAVAAYQQALVLDPNHARAQSNLGNTLKQLGRAEDALASYDKAIAIQPDYADAHNNRGVILQELQRLDEALASYRKVLALQSDYPFMAGIVLHTELRLCQWDNVAQSSADLRARIDSGAPAAPPFATLAIFDDAALQRTAAEVLVRTLHPPRNSLDPIAARPRGGKIRIGYYSADFHNHATAYLMAELFEKHAKSRFELHAFSFGPDKADTMRRRIVAAFDRFHDVRLTSDVDVARLSRTLGIDIAIDLKGFTQDQRAGIFAERCAPLQVNYLGYPGTMGAPYIDYIIADPVLIPPQARQFYSEKVVSMPHSYQVNDATRMIAADPPTRAAAGLPPTGFVFCCFNKNYKITPETFASWMNILKAVDGSVLWLFADNASAERNLRREAERAGVASTRLVFAAPLPLPQHLARHELADLFLDTAPYNAHTTASDALWAGLPLLTLIGQCFASRVAASLLFATGLRELVARTREEFEAKAISLATEPARLAQFRTRLVDQRPMSPLFDAARFAKQIEAVYSAMYERHHAGLPPEHIDVKE